MYEQFKVSLALGAELDAPAGVNIYLAQGIDNDGVPNFSGIYSTRQIALEALAEFALEELESLDYSAPWITMNYYEREKLTEEEFTLMSRNKMDAWKARNSLESIINAFWNPTENPDFDDSWSVRKIKVK